MRFFTFLIIVIFLLCPTGASGADVFKDLEVHGFIEGAFGLRLKDDTTKHDSYNLLEQRVQLKTSYYPQSGRLADLYTAFHIKGDVLIDEYFDVTTESELREASVSFTPFDWADVKLGRQVFTWGTGDYLFINDLFPKDYVSFFVGRDDEYLKKPSDGIKVSVYHDLANTDLVAIPFFEPNTMATGDRLSFFDSFQGGIAGRESERHLIEPANQLEHMEVATRLYRNLKSYEAAFYFFRGFYKAPVGYKNEALRHLFYPRLDVYGGSLRGPLLAGIANVEAGYYNSRQDTKGSNRLIQNSAFKVLAGYSKDFGSDLSMGLQYLYERTLDYSNYKKALLPADFVWDEHRHLTTIRITKLLANQTIKLSLFAFYSPSDEDVYLRPLFEYDISDSLTVAAGANLMWGEQDITEFGQMERNANLYARLRYSF